MSTNIADVAMTQPTVDPGIDAGGDFLMGGQIQVSGGGGWSESGDMYFEWDQGIGSWDTLGLTGDLNVASQTNPITGLQDADEHTITVYNDGTTGSFQVRVKLIEDDLTEHTTTPVDVRLSSSGTNYQRAVEGSFPAQSGVLSRKADFARNIDGELPGQAGSLSRKTSFLRMAQGAIDWAADLIRKSDFKRSTQGDI